MADTKKSSQKGGTSKLTKTSKKGQIELKEDELGRVSGGNEPGIEPCCNSTLVAKLSDSTLLTKSAPNSHSTRSAPVKIAFWSRSNAGRFKVFPVSLSSNHPTVDGSIRLPSSQRLISGFWLSVFWLADETRQ